jgi:hypothetical protein
MSWSFLLSLKNRRMVWLRADARLAVTNSCASCDDHAISSSSSSSVVTTDWRQSASTVACGGGRGVCAHLVAGAGRENAENVPLLQRVGLQIVLRRARRWCRSCALS